MRWKICVCIDITTDDILRNKQAATTVSIVLPYIFIILVTKYIVAVGIPTYAWPYNYLDFQQSASIHFVDSASASKIIGQVCCGTISTVSSDYLNTIMRIVENHGQVMSITLLFVKLLWHWLSAACRLFNY